MITRHSIGAVCPQALRTQCLIERREEHAACVAIRTRLLLCAHRAVRPHTPIACGLCGSKAALFADTALVRIFAADKVDFWEFRVEVVLVTLLGSALLTIVQSVNIGFAALTADITPTKFWVAVWCR
jgi:hypothetical protein